MLISMFVAMVASAQNSLGFGHPNLLSHSSSCSVIIRIGANLGLLGVWAIAFFVTADEAAYPLLLCQRVVDALLELCFPDVAPPSPVSAVPFAGKNTRIALGIQPRGKALGPLVSEFSHQIAFVCAASKQAASLPFLQSLPKGSKILRRRLLNGVTSSRL